MTSRSKQYCLQVGKTCMFDYEKKGKEDEDSGDGTL